MITEPLKSIKLHVGEESYKNYIQDAQHNLSETMFRNKLNNRLRHNYVRPDDNRPDCNTQQRRI